MAFKTISNKVIHYNVTFVITDGVTVEFDGNTYTKDTENVVELANGTYTYTASAEGYAMSDGTPLKLSDKDQKWLGVKDTFLF